MVRNEFLEHFKSITLQYIQMICNEFLEHFKSITLQYNHLICNEFLEFWTNNILKNTILQNFRKDNIKNLKIIFRFLRN